MSVHIKKSVADVLQKYEKMNAFVERERVTSLPKLTVQEAYERYNDLCRVWEQTKKKRSSDIQLLDRLKIEEIVARRRLFDQLGKQKQKI